MLMNAKRENSDSAPASNRIVVTRWQIVSERSTSDNSGCEQLRHRSIRLVNYQQPFRSHIKGSVVGAAGQALCAPYFPYSANRL